MAMAILSKSSSARIRSRWLDFGLAVSVCLGAVEPGRTTPFTPSDDHQVLERLPAKTSSADLLILRRARAALTNDPENLQTSLRLARDYIAKSRAESDPRYLGYAQATLAPWWDSPDPPVDILVLRATIRQSNHDFDNALADLAKALKADPANGQAWLTRATILQVLGEYDDAKRACLPLWRLASELITVTCASSIASLSGEAARSYELLDRTLERNFNAAASERLWALTVLAEIAVRLGRDTEAESYFRRALALELRDGYLLGAYADFLLDHDRPTEVTDLLKDETRVDGLLLRVTLAEKSLRPQPAAFTAHGSALRERFAASRQRGDKVHRREEARFTLHLLNQPKEALRLAKENWTIQREPADARILLESALAAKDPASARPVMDSLEKNHLEDLELAKLASQFNTGFGVPPSGGRKPK
ncbi:MAG: tetratricopeptide repeat protein [Verrucomicrobiota bacterium]